MLEFRARQRRRASTAGRTGRLSRRQFVVLYHDGGCRGSESGNVEADIIIVEEVW